MNGTCDLPFYNTQGSPQAAASQRCARLRVFEGQSHAQYVIDKNAPETRELFDKKARLSTAASLADLCVFAPEWT